MNFFTQVSLVNWKKFYQLIENETWITFTYHYYYYYCSCCFKKLIIKITKEGNILQKILWRNKQTKKSIFVNFEILLLNDKLSQALISLAKYLIELIAKDITYSVICDLTWLCYHYTNISGFTIVVILWHKTLALHKKWNFPLRVSLVNVAKFIVTSGFDHTYWRHP